MLLHHTGVTMAQLGQFAIVSSLTMILVHSAKALFNAALPMLSRSTQRAGPKIAAYGRLTATAIATAAGLDGLLGPPVAEWALGTPYAVAGGLLAPFMLVGDLILAPTG
jgi:O-antigen/teichoic acid export membrane protein